MLESMSHLHNQKGHHPRIHMTGKAGDVGKGQSFDGSGKKHNNFGSESKDSYRNQNMKYYPYDTPGHTTNELYICYRDICTFKFFVSLLTITRKQNQQRYPCTEWIKMWYVQLMKYYLKKGKEIMQFVNKWKKLQNIVLSNVTCSRQMPHVLSYGDPSLKFILQLFNLKCKYKPRNQKGVYQG